MNISMDKKYQTREGLEACILAVDINNIMSVVALIKTKSEDVISTYTPEGHYYYNPEKEYRRDLVEVDQDKTSENKRTHNGKWLRENALFSCCDGMCGAEYSYRTIELSIHPKTGKPVSCDCYYNNDDNDLPPDDPEWNDLETFQPFSLEDSGN